MTASPVSNTDLDLVHALQIAPRASWADLGRALGYHPATLSQRWSRLRELGAAWSLGHLSGTHGRQCAAYVEIEADPADLERTRVELCALREVRSVISGTRQADFLLTCIATSWEEMAAQVLPAIGGVAGVRRMHTSLMLHLHASGENWQIDQLDPRRKALVQALVPSPSSESIRRTPALDALVSVLEADGRAPVSAIAERIGNHPSTAARLLNAALRAGYVAVRCEVAPYWVGYPLTVLWRVRLPHGAEEAALAVLRSFRTLRLCSSVTGESNFLFMMQLHSTSQIVEIERRLLDEVPEARILETAAGIIHHKRMGWILDGEGMAIGMTTSPALGPSPDAFV